MYTCTFNKNMSIEKRIKLAYEFEVSDQWIINLTTERFRIIA